MTVVRFLQESCQRRPDHPALVAPDGETWTFAEFEARVDWMAAGLRAEGVEPGDRVILMVPMSLQLYQALVAVLKVGAVAVFVDPWVGARQIANFAAYAEPRGFIGVGKSHLVRLFDKTLRTLPVTVTTGGRFLCVPARRSWLEVERCAGIQRPHRVLEEDTALITFTSGSSGVPKGADRSHRFLTAQRDAINGAFPSEPGDVDMPTFPVFSLNNLANGVTTVIPDVDLRRVAEADGARILEQIDEYGVNTAAGSPPFFDRLCDALEAADRRATFRRVLTGGAPVSDRQLKRWRRWMPDTEILVVYGSTEAEPVAHVDADERLTLSASDVARPGYCVGRLVDTVEGKVIPIRRGPIEIGDGALAELALAQGEVGELLVRGESVCTKYFRNPRAMAENKIVDEEGRIWHRMGDTGYFDEEGRFWLTGRVHSTILRGEEELQAQVVEQVARGDDERVVQVAALGESDRAGGDERLVVVVYGGEGFSGDPQTLCGDVERRLQEAGIAADEVCVSAEPLPVDPRHNSKIDYGALRARRDV